MKKLLFLSVVMLLLISCSKDDDPSTSQPNAPKEIETSIGLSGEILDIDNSPLLNGISDENLKSTTTTSNDMYEIKVLSKSNLNDSYTAYAHGMFDSVDGLKIKLIEGHFYRFACELIVDAKTKLYHTELSQLTNTFSYVSPGTYLPDGHGSILMADGKPYYCPSIDIFFGITTNLMAEQGIDININMKRTAFGVKVVSNVISDGKIKIEISEAPAMYINAGETSAQEIFALQPDEPSGSWTDDAGTWTDDGKQSSQVTVIWVKSNGEEIPIASKTITFYRNTLTTITVNVVDNSSSKSITISHESADMLEGETVALN